MPQVNTGRLPENLRERIEVAGDFNEALDIFMELIADLGFTQIVYAYLPVRPRLPTGEWLPLKLNVRNFPIGWEDGWKQFMTVDPYYRACFDGTLPIDWTDVQAGEQLSSPQRAACSYLSDFGLSRGTTVPVHLPFGRFAVMSAIVDRSCVQWSDMKDVTREPLFRLMHVFTKTIHDMHFEDQIDTVTGVKLTPREVECLKWASAGKTSGDISIILDRSIETIRLHIKNAMTKLDATSRSQAVAKAVHLGLI